jgi:hypothetical protein
MNVLPRFRRTRTCPRHRACESPLLETLLRQAILAWPAWGRPSLDLADHSAIASFARSASIDLGPVGSEAPLVAGIFDHQRRGSPSARRGRPPGSGSGLCRGFRHRHAIPTAVYACFTDAVSASAYAREKAPIRSRPTDCGWQGVCGHEPR